MGALLGVAAPTGSTSGRDGTDTPTAATTVPTPPASGKERPADPGQMLLTPEERGLTRDEAHAKAIEYQNQFLDQCGLEDDKDEWEVWAGPQRIKTTQLTPEEQAKFKGLLDLIFSHEVAVLGMKVVFEPGDVADVMRKVIPYLKSEPTLIEDVPFDINIVGDIHGQLHDLHRIFLHDSKDGKPGWELKKYIFLGDYVDRGRQSLEVVMALFCIKMLRPDSIFLLRGNHEFHSVNLTYGLGEDVCSRYGKEISVPMFFQINEAFVWMSIAAIVGNSYFCAHGGISAAAFTRRTLRGIYKPIFEAGEDIVVHDVVWSDPAQGMKGTTYNFKRGSSIFFGFDALSHALVSMEVKAVFRAHSYLKTGYECIWHSLHSIFSASDYDFMNSGVVAELDSMGKLTLRTLVADPKRSEWDDKLIEMDGKCKEAVREEFTRSEILEGQLSKMDAPA